MPKYSQLGSTEKPFRGKRLTLCVWIIGDFSGYAASKVGCRYHHICVENLPKKH